MRIRIPPFYFMRIGIRIRILASKKKVQNLEKMLK
jgi:hypothetical protein